MDIKQIKFFPDEKAMIISGSYFPEDIPVTTFQGLAPAVLV